MRHKRRFVIPLLLSLACVTALFCVGRKTAEAGRGLIIAVPKAGAVSVTELEAIPRSEKKCTFRSTGGCSEPKTSNGAQEDVFGSEYINDGQRMLTYANRYEQSARALQRQYPVTVIGTNPAYPYVMRHPLTGGGFFNREQFKYKNKVAALNEKAAFQMFGTLDAAGNEIALDGKTYSVTGVIDDGDDERLHIYLPATCLGDTAEAVMIHRDDRSQETDALQNAGLNALDFTFFDLGRIAEMTEDMAYASLGIAALSILWAAGRKTVGAALRYAKRTDRRRQEVFSPPVLKATSTNLKETGALGGREARAPARGDFSQRRKIPATTATVSSVNRGCLKCVGLMLLTAGMLLAGLAILPPLFEIFLRWESLRGFFTDMGPTPFGALTDTMRRLYWGAQCLECLAFLMIRFITIHSVPKAKHSANAVV